MPITLNRKVRFSHPDFTYTGANYTEFLYGSLGLKVNADIRFEVAWGSYDINAVFETTGDTITRNDSGSFWLDGFHIGDTITIQNTVSNNISTTITDISDTGQVMTVAGLSGNETANAADIHGVTSITSIDFYPNLIPNSVGFNLFNLTDRETIPRYSADTISTDAANPTPMQITTNSQGWVTPSDAATIYRLSVASFIQTFIISHTFTITPIFIANQLAALKRGIPPAAGAYKDRDCLKYIFSIDGKFEAYNPDPPQTSDGYILFPKGQVGWFNEFINGRPTVWTKESLLYFDNATGGALTAVDYCKVNDVVAKLVCQTTVDTANLIVHVLYLPLNEDRYVNTTTQWKTNFIYERAVLNVGAAMVQGENTGDYHFLKDVIATSPSLNHVTVEFQIDYSQTVIDFFDTQDASNLNYLIFITAQNSV